MRSAGNFVRFIIGSKILAGSMSFQPSTASTMMLNFEKPSTRRFIAPRSGRPKRIKQTPGKLKDKHKWPEWEPAFVNYLLTIPGVSGVAVVLHC